MATRINGQDASWSAIKFTFLEEARLNIIEIKYSDSLEAENNYAVGTTPVSYSLGNYKAELEIKMLLSEWEKIEAKAPNGIYMLDPFDVVVSYKIGSGATTTDTIPGVKIINVEKSAKSGDKNAIAVPLKTLVTGVIKWNGKPAIKTN